MKIITKYYQLTMINHKSNSRENHFKMKNNSTKNLKQIQKINL